MKPVTREQILELYEQGWSKQDAKAHLRRETALQSLKDLQQQCCWGSGDQEIMSIMAYILENMVVKS